MVALNLIPVALLLPLLTSRVPPQQAEGAGLTPAVDPKEIVCRSVEIDPKILPGVQEVDPK